MRFSLALLLSIVQGARVARHADHVSHKHPQYPAPIAQVVQAPPAVAEAPFGPESTWGKWGPCILNVVTGKRERTASCLQSGLDRGLCRGTLHEECPDTVTPPSPQPSTTTKTITTTAPPPPAPTGEIWSKFGPYGACVNGIKTRTRTCVSNDPNLCQGVLHDKALCTPTAVVPPPAAGACAPQIKTSLMSCLTAPVSALNCRFWYNQNHVRMAEGCIAAWNFTPSDMLAFHQKFAQFMQKSS